MCGSSAVERHVEDFLDDPLGVLVNDEGIFLIRVALVTERSVGKDALSLFKLRVERALHLAAGVLGKPLIE